jgi:16S rRNA (cytosine1402-N4)-methyltransferase
MLQETLRLLDPQPGETLIDLTCGLGGHAAAILEKTADDGQAILIDWDPAMLQIASQRLQPYLDRVQMYSCNFTELAQIMQQGSVQWADLAVLDAGVARPQLIDPERGFGFEGSSLDMRMSQEIGPSAHEVINTASETELRRILRLTQSPRESRSIAAAICRARRRGTIEASSQLADIIEVATSRGKMSGRRQPASAMLAFRVYINRELENLQAGVEAMVKALRPGSGKMVVLTYHSLEFRIVRQTMERLVRGHDAPPWLPEPPDACPMIVNLCAKPLKPSASEAPTCRSVRLFAARATEYERRV